eukprot:gene6627-4747_t
MLWVDKYRPRTLDETELYPEMTETLRRLAASKDIPHLLFFGPSGSGRKTRAMSLLRDVYGPGVAAVRLEHKSLAVTDSKVVDIALLSSPHHMDMNPSDAGNYDRVVVMQMIKEMAKTVPLQRLRKRPDPIGGITGATANAEEGLDAVPYKVVVLNEVDRMTKSAQHALRRTMEKYMKTCRLILICSSLSRLIAPLRSRCLAIRVPGHPQENLQRAVRRVCAGEGLMEPSDSFISLLYQRCDGNLRRGILMLEAAVMNKVDLSGAGGDIPLPDWKLFLQDAVQVILTEQSPKALHDVRRMYYDVLGHCIAGETVLRELTDALVASLPAALQPAIFRLAAQYDYNMRVGTKPVLHLEAFTAGVMQLARAQGLTLRPAPFHVRGAKEAAQMRFEMPKTRKLKKIPLNRTPNCGSYSALAALAISVECFENGATMFRWTSAALRPCGLFSATLPLPVAHWYAGHKFRHRFMRDKRFHPSHQAASDARNRFSRRRHFKTNRWNYAQAYKDMP